MVIVSNRFESHCPKIQSLENSSPKYSVQSGFQYFIPKSALSVNFYEMFEESFWHKKKKRERETQTKQNKQELWKGKQGRKKQDKGNKITSLKGVCVCAHPLCANTCVCLYIQRQFLNCVVWKPQGVPKAFSGGL